MAPIYDILPEPMSDAESGEVVDNRSDGSDDENSPVSYSEDGARGCFTGELCSHSTSLSQMEEAMIMEDPSKYLNGENHQCNNDLADPNFHSEPVQSNESSEERLVAEESDCIGESSPINEGQEKANPENSTVDISDKTDIELKREVEPESSNAADKAATKSEPTTNNFLQTGWKLSSKDGEEYIETHETKASKIPQLGISARLMYGSMELVIHSKGCLMVTDDNFVAKVKLDGPYLLSNTWGFRHAVGKLLDQLQIEEVLLDELITHRDKHREILLAKLEHMVKSCFDEGKINRRIEVLKFVKRLAQRNSFSYLELCHTLTNNRIQYEALQEHAITLTKMEQKASQREHMFRRFGHYQKNVCLSARLNSFLEHIGEHHRNSLHTEAPAYLHESLNTIKFEHLMLISSNDVKLFTDMSNVLRADIFEKPLQDLAKRWSNRVKSINVGTVNGSLQLTSVSIFYLCKSLEEVIVEITENTDHRVTDLLNSSDLGWYPVENIKWKSENELTRCIQREYYFIFRILKHFEVTSNFGRQPFQYNMQLFNGSQPQSGGSILSGVKNTLLRTGKFFGYTKPETNPFGVSDDFYVWYCLLDDVLFHVLANGGVKDVFENVFEGYEQMIRDANYDQMETLRVVTHNLVRYIAQSYSYDGSTSLNASLGNAVLRKQLDIFSFKTSRNVEFSIDFRDQLDVFNTFWKTRNDIIEHLPTKINLPKINLIQQRLMDIMLVVLDKDVEANTRVAFFRTYNDFLIDLNDVSFDWYIKTISGIDMEPVIALKKVELVNNKWKDTNNRIYRVLDPKNFATIISTLTENRHVPKHYVIDVIEALLDFIGSQLQRTCWITGQSLSATDQVVSTTELICAIKNSLLYLKEQVDYVSFDLFYDERVKPFASVLEGATSRQDFSSRINLIRESFWYIRKQNEISFEDALQLYSKLNNLHNSNQLRQSYAKYCEYFEEFMQLCAHEDYPERAALIVDKIKALLPDPIQFKAWDDRFKQDRVPQILAGLSAVWSILMSKDVVSAGKYFSPHCIQVMCVFRLLSVDRAERGIDKHLAQVLTGQGKSLVLGLLAALFALTGHNVRVACYSEYLAERDEQDFHKFYEMFYVAENIMYGTFYDLADAVTSPSVNGQKIQLRDLVSDLLFKEKTILPQRLVNPDSSTDILLIDEVDVFFTKDFYGTTYNPCCTPLIPGLACIQEQIWKYVQSGFGDIETHIQNFIQHGQFEQQKLFLEFLERPNNYTVYKNGGSLKTYTNKTLFNEHLKLMIDDARSVHNQPSFWVNFKLNSEGMITYIRHGVYEESYFWRYHNVFNYFRLKKDNFVTHVQNSRVLEKNYARTQCKNYGYLNIGCGSLSYAMLPINYPLIVGVSGTLTSLNQYEQNTVEQLYNIRDTSVMPSFFGCSNLKFDEIVNFHHHTTKHSWRSYIFHQANQMITANRAVIVFFETDVELDTFKAEYAGQFDRLNVLTENTDDKGRFISEAGVAKTITLATRGMGRGVDYKSSVTVEKNGGVHIIQTFFSMDVKEETQIKGRTARKDNKGSYELIVFDEDLRSNGLLVNNCSVTYAELDAARRNKSLIQNEQLSIAIKECMDTHKNTINYMTSFFKN